MATRTAKASKSKSINKAQAIRDAFQSMGIATRPKDLIAELGRKKIRVSPAQVSNVRAALLKGKVPGRRGRPPRAESVSVPGLMRAKAFADQVGGVDEAKRTLDLLARLS